MPLRGPAHAPVAGDALRRLRDVHEQLALQVEHLERVIAVLVDEDRQIAVVRGDGQRLDIPVGGVLLRHHARGDVVIREVLELAALVRAQEERVAPVHERGVGVGGVCAGRTDVLRLAGLKVEHPQVVVAQALELVVEQVAPVRGERRRPVVAVLVLQHDAGLTRLHIQRADVEVRGAARVGRIHHGFSVRGHAAELVARLGVVRQVHRLAGALFEQEDLLLLVAAVIHRQERVLAVGRGVQAPHAVAKVRALHGGLARAALPDLVHAAAVAQEQKAPVLHEHAVRGCGNLVKCLDVSHCVFLLSPAAHCPRMRGSKASRRPLPKRLNASISSEMTSAGNSVRCGSVVRKPCPSASSTPMDGSGACMPRPR